MGTVAVGKNQAVIAAYLTMPVDLGSSALAEDQRGWACLGAADPDNLFFRRYQKADSAGTVSYEAGRSRSLDSPPESELPSQPMGIKFVIQKTNLFV